MKKELFLNFAKLCGFTIQPEHLLEAEAITANASTPTDPAPVEQQAPETPAPVAPVAVVNATVAPAPVSTPAPVAVAAPAPAVALTANAFPPANAPATPAPAQPPAGGQNLQMLDELINAIGGFEAFKGLLLKLAEMGQAAAAPVANSEAVQHEQRANAVIAQLVANSQGRLKSEDLSGMSLEALEALGALGQAVQANAAPTRVDFSGLGVFRSNSAVTTANAELANGAPRPSILLGKPSTS